MPETGPAHVIDTLDELRRHLQWAIELEHAKPLELIPQAA